MKARKKGTQEWKEYGEVFGPDHEFLGLETLGCWQSDEDYCKEHGIPYDPESPFNHGGYYKSAVLPLECFDLWEEPDWSAFRREAAKDILCALIADGQIPVNADSVTHCIGLAEALIKRLKDEKK